MRLRMMNNEQGVVVCAYNPSTQEADLAGLSI
jgi:hypothetical protein